MITEEQLKEYAEKIKRGIRGYSLEKLTNMPPQYASTILFYYTQLVEKENDLIYATLIDELERISIDFLKAQREKEYAKEKFLLQIKTYKSKGQFVPAEEGLKYSKIALQYNKKLAYLLQYIWNNRADIRALNTNIDPNHIFSYFEKTKKEIISLTNVIKALEEKITNGR